MKVNSQTLIKSYQPAGGAKNAPQNQSGDVADRVEMGGLAPNLHCPDGRWSLKALADKALVDGRQATDYPADVKKQVDEILADNGPASESSNLRHQPFPTIDNGMPRMESTDLEMFLSDRKPLVANGSPLDKFNGPSIYPADKTYNLVPAELESWNLAAQAPDKFSKVTGFSVYPADKTYNLIPKELAGDVISLIPREEHKLDYASGGGLARQ